MQLDDIGKDAVVVDANTGAAVIDRNVSRETDLRGTTTDRCSDRAWAYSCLGTWTEGGVLTAG